MLLVEDVDAAVEWYNHVLGGRLQHSLPDTPPFQWASILLSDVEVMFAGKRDAQKWYSDRVGISEAPTNFIAYIYVTDANGLYDQIKARVKVVMEPTDQPYGIREFAIEDPFGFVSVFAEVIA